jgi:hypothetical protein
MDRLGAEEEASRRMTDPAPRPTKPYTETPRDERRIEQAETARDPLWAVDPGPTKWWGEEREFGEPGQF